MKKTEKTFQFADKAEYLDSHGKAAKMDSFHPGDHVLLTEKDGKIIQLKKGMDRAYAKITKVDADKGTVTVKMKNKDGKDVEKTFYLTEDVESIDSTGKVAVIDIFRSGDDVLFIEADGKISELSKDMKQKKTEDKSTASGDKKPSAK